MKALFAVLLQFLHPEEAYGCLHGDGQNLALAGTIVIILSVGFLPVFLLGGTVSETDMLLIPLWIVVERIVLAAAAGLAAYALSFALGGKNPLWPAVAASFLSMGAFMLVVAILAVLSYLLSLPPGFTWSPAEALVRLPVSRLSVFLVLFASRFDPASLIAVYLWGRGLSVGWGETTGFGQRLAWSVYLFGVLLVSFPVFVAPVE